MTEVPDSFDYGCDYRLSLSTLQNFIKLKHSTSQPTSKFRKMAASSEPLAQLSHLPKADGSATFSYCGYAVTAAVNGPIEAPRRDENPFEALVDVIVRPAAGVGGKD